jgi:uncharacterized membrane protein (UPF0182 family)
VTFFSTSDFWDVPLDPNPTASSYQPPYYIVAKDLAKNDSSASFQLTSAMNRFRRDFLAAYISASSDPATYGKITVLTIPGQVNGPKLANNAITTDTAVSQDLGVIGRDNQNRIRWGNLLTLPVSQGGLLYVEPVYASPGASDAASSYPRLIRVAMMYNDKVGYGPTVSDALNELFGPGAGATATGPAPTGPVPAAPPPPPDGQPPAAPPPANQAAPEVPTPVAAVPPGAGSASLSAAKAAALQEVQSALDNARQAQQSGNFADYGQALQRLDDAMNKYTNTK